MQLKSISYIDYKFKLYKVVNLFMTTIRRNTIEENRFKTISDFKWCVDCGGEVEFEWKGKSYSVTHPEGRINIGEGYYKKDGKYFNALSHEECIDVDGMWGDTVDEILEYKVGGDRLRDVITQVEVTERTI